MGSHSDNFRSGFVAIVGAPNVGKSTLLNRVLGEKISITSRKPQTTRNRISGVVHRDGAQIVLVDTPGIHRPEGELNVRMVAAAMSVLADVDLVLLVVDGAHPDMPSEEHLSEALLKTNRPVLLALNKMDLVKKSVLQPLIEKWENRHSFAQILPISARHGTEIEALLEAIVSLLPYGPPYFPEDSLTDVPERFIAAEIIREKAFRLTGQEIPYAVAVTVDAFNRKKRDLIRIHASIHVERQSQKGIVIGKNGSKLKRIGEDARIDIEKMLGSPVFLKLFVHVQKNWRQDTRALRKFGY